MSYSEIVGFILIFFLALFVMLFTSMDWPRFFGFETAASKNTYWANIERKPNGTGFYSHKGDRERYEYHHNKNEKRYWIASILLSTFTIAVAVIGAIFAGLAYNAAHFQAMIAEKSLTSTQRAFVYVKNPNPPLEYHIVNGSFSYIFQPTWQAIGFTQPVRLKVGLLCQPVLVAPLADRIHEEIFTRINSQMRNRITGPGQEFNGTTCFFDPDHVKTVQAGIWWVIVYLRAEYQDVFGKNHLTERCDLIEGLGEDQLGGKTASGKPNLIASGSPCDTHNCTDEQCADFNPLGGDQFDRR